MIVKNLSKILEDLKIQNGKKAVRDFYTELSAS